MSIKQVRLSNQAKEQLIRLKTRTGIQQWNILCRWALCLSLKEKTPPTPIDIPADSNVEMTWQVFGGEHTGRARGRLNRKPVGERGQGSGAFGPGAIGDSCKYDG